MFVSILRVISIDESSPLWNISRSLRSRLGSNGRKRERARDAGYISCENFPALDLKKTFWTFPRYSSCFMWNVEMGRTSGRRAARSFCEAILWQNDRLLGCWATRRWRLWLFTIYKKIPEILVGNFRSVRTVRVVYHLPKISGLSRRARLDSSYNMKLVRNSRNL